MKPDLAQFADRMGRKLAHQGLPPSLEEVPYLSMREELQKIAEDHPSFALNPEVLKAVLKATAVMTVGGGIGYAGGKLLGKHVADVLEKRTGHSISSPKIAPYFAAGTALLGGVLLAAEAARDKKFKEVLHDAYQRSQEQHKSGKPSQ